MGSTYRIQHVIMRAQEQKKLVTDRELATSNSENRSKKGGEGSLILTIHTSNMGPGRLNSSSSSGKDQIHCATGKPTHGIELHSETHRRSRIVIRQGKLVQLG